MDVRLIIVNLITAVLSFLSPITDFMTAAGILFGMNFVCGLLADIISGNDWSWKKAFTFILYCFIFFGLATFIYMCGHYMHNEAGAIQMVSWVCYAAIYIYGVNILRNMKVLVKDGTPLYRLLDFCYYVLTLKFCKNIPYWREYASTHPEKEIKK